MWKEVTETNVLLEYNIFPVPFRNCDLWISSGLIRVGFRSNVSFGEHTSISVSLRKEDRLV
jgi:hypothetical protein